MPEVTLVHRSGAAVLTGDHLSGMIPHDGMFYVSNIFVTAGMQTGFLRLSSNQEICLVSPLPGILIDSIQHPIPPPCPRSLPIAPILVPLHPPPCPLLHHIPSYIRFVHFCDRPVPLRHRWVLSDVCRTLFCFPVPSSAVMSSVTAMPLLAGTSNAATPPSN